MAQREQIEITAYHEAGHAVMAMSVGFPVTEVSCQASNSAYGHTAWQMPLPIASASRIGAVLTLAAGMAADYLHWKRLPHRDERELSQGHTGDRSDAREHLHALGQGDVFDSYLSLAINHLQRDDVWPCIELIAQVLKQVGLINGRDILDSAMQSLPRLSARELERMKRAVDLQQG